MKSSCPASLDTLKISVPPAVKLAPASANLDDFVNCYFGRARSPSAPKDTDGPTVRPYRLSRHERQPADRFRFFTYADLFKRDP